MTFVIGVLIFVVALLVSVMLHEAGHFVTAKIFGMKATQFFVGFGTTLWSRRRGETEYGVKALPVGGFVKITGMTTMDEVDPADEPRSFRSKPGWQRSIVLAAGSFMHFVIAFVLLWILAVGVGLSDQNSTTVSVLPCVPTKQQAACAQGDPKSPAVLAGLRPGDKIIAIAGQPVHNWTQLGEVIKEQPAGTPVAFTIVRGKRQLNEKITLASVSWRKGAYLGVQPVQVYTRIGPFSAVSYAGSQFGSIVSQSVTALGRIPRAIPYLFAKDRANTPGGQVSSMFGAASITGQVVAANFGWQQKATIVLLIIIEVNIFVGIFNLLPLLPLDGGHLAIVLFERARAGWARLRRRPDPGLVDIQRLIPVSVGVFALLVALGLLLIAADIFNPVTLVQ
ncbi:MAG TPA: site-2 protease family protein [Streptosporangiaceae bacterium]|nr:site-2 protease family protein [Streptosporangiaceae bacterium]